MNTIGTMFTICFASCLAGMVLVRTDLLSAWIVGIVVSIMFAAAFTVAYSEN